MSGVDQRRVVPSHGVRHQLQGILHDPANGRYGDCHRTSIAMALGLDREEVPHFCDPALFDEWRSARDAWLADRGLAAVELPFPADNDLPLVLDQLKISCGDAPAMLAGYSPRGTYHETTVWRGEILDPHPEGGGLVAPHENGYWWVTLFCAQPGFFTRDSDGSGATGSTEGDSAAIAQPKAPQS